MLESDYMCDAQLSHFFYILDERKYKYVKSIYMTKELLDEFNNHVDDSEIKNQPELQNIYLKRLTKETKILSGVDSSILAIENKTYGYCTKTGAKIGIERLIEKPTETLCR
jgi:DnaK suppressor protein